VGAGEVPSVLVARALAEAEALLLGAAEAEAAALGVAPALRVPSALRLPVAGAEAQPLWLRSPLYPEYYLNAWHHQSDGWLSASSAAVYDASTESLFIGRQDAMQRSALALLCRHLRGDAAADGGAPPRPDASTAPRVLDVAAGTGRLLTFVRDEFPAAGENWRAISENCVQKTFADKRGAIRK
jgi:hypothetical protein